MKKLFGRDKPKIVKVTSGTREDIQGDNYAHPSQRHDRAHAGSEDWDLISETDPPLQPLRPPALQAPGLVHQSSTPGSGPLSRSGSPFAPSSPSIPSIRTTNGKERETPQVLRKKSPANPAPLAAVGILRALDPHPHPHAEPPHSYEPSDDGTTDASHKEEKKDKRSFWDRAAGHRDKDKDRDKERERDRARDKEEERKKEKREDDPAELTRMIGFLTATASEDWSLVLEVCDRASSSEANAKEAVRALRREFKYAEPSAQLSAARLWAIMLRNSSDTFIYHCTSRKFLDTLEDVLASSRTSPVVRERLLEVLSAAAYASAKDGTFRTLWRKVKPADKPEEGIPFDTEDAMFYPPTPRHSMPPNPLPPPQVEPPVQRDHPPRPPPTVTPGKTKSSRNRVIPLEEDIRRLFQECKVGRGNANLLSEALTYAKPEDLKQKDIIKEFYARCRASQELISAQIPWAFAQAERSRVAAGGDPTKPKERRPSNESYRNPPSSPKHERKEKETKDDAHLTTEEKLLAAILAANEDLLEALRLYDDLERVGIERDAEERSKKETRMDRTRLRTDENDNTVYLEPGQPIHGAGSSSRSASPSPSPSPSPAPSLFVEPPAGLPHAPHVRSDGHHSVTTHGSLQSLAPPPPAPHGPRQPAQPRSRTPSPERGAPVATIRGPRGSNDSGRAHPRPPPEAYRPQSSTVPDVNEEPTPPIQPSAKALGKRKVLDGPVEGERPFDSDDLFYEHREEQQRNSDEPLDSDSETERAKNPWHRPVHYVYDAAAERTEQRIREGRLAMVALVDSVR